MSTSSGSSFPLIEVTQRLGVNLVDSLPERRRTTIYAIASGSWTGTRYFDGDGVCHTITRVVPPRPVGVLDRVLAWTIYNPSVDARMEYEPPRAYGLDELRAILGKAVDADDDILTQWHEASTLHEMLRAATTYGDLVETLRFAETPADDERGE